jgi:hypothetical protein
VASRIGSAPRAPLSVAELARFGRKRRLAMLNKFLRCGVLMVALSAPLGGCLEIAGSKMNRGPTAPQASPCPHGAQSAGETVGYGCAPPAPAAY